MRLGPILRLEGYERAVQGRKAYSRTAHAMEVTKLTAAMHAPKQTRRIIEGDEHLGLMHLEDVLQSKKGGM